MRRWITRILICLPLGTLTTVGVAWGLAMENPDSPSAGWVRDVRGWPQQSMQRSFEWYYRYWMGDTATPGTVVVTTVESGLLVVENRAPPLVLPLRPIWPGFLIDALFYGALWFGLLFGFGAAKRTLRTRRGLCPKCAYDLRGNFDRGCPECGWNRNGCREG